jgi:ribosomal protein S18 acetylase RimI-like enzyme
MNVTLRPEAPHDQSFLRQLITETIAAELGASNWPEPVRGPLIELQYRGRRHFPGAESRVIEADGMDAGWMVVTTMPHEVRLVEIMVAPQFRGKGIGAAAIRRLLDAAAGYGKPVRLHVNVTNVAAIRLYERLGFRRTGGDEVQLLMERAA